MALGYGHYGKRDKKLPGVYVNFGKAKTQASTPRGATATTAGMVVSSSDYEKLLNHPKINDVELVGNKSFEELGDKRLGNRDIQTVLDDAF